MSSGVIVASAKDNITGQSSNYYGFSNWEGIKIDTAGIGFNSTGPLTPASALAIDTKIDDGNSFGGNVGGQTTFGGYYNCTTGAGQPYDLTQKDPICSLAVKLLSQTNSSLN